MNEPYRQYPQNNRPYESFNNHPRQEITNVNVNPNRNIQNVGDYQYQYQNNHFGPFVINQPQPISPSNNQNQPASFNQQNLQNFSIQRNPVPQQQRNRSHYNNQQSHRVNISQQRQYKMDGIFAQSFTSLKRQFLLHTIIVFALLFAVLMLYKFDIFKQHQGYMHGVILQDGQLKQSIVPFLILAQTLIVFLKLYIYFNTYHKLDFAIQVANYNGHGVLTQRANKQQSFDDNISQLYLLISTEVTYEQGMQQSIKNMHKEITMNQIRTCTKTKVCCSYQFHQLFQFGMFVCAIYLIVVLAQDQTTWLQKLVLITTIVYWLLQNWKLIIYTLLLLLCPLITLGIIIYACIVAGTPRREFTIPQAINPTNEQIVNCGGTCSICMMEFDKNSNAIVLPCSDKHMFHQLCIKGWLNLKTTCPNCRYDLSTA